MNSRTAQSKLIKRARLILSGHDSPLYKFVMRSQVIYGKSGKYIYVITHATITHKVDGYNERTKL